MAYGPALHDSHEALRSLERINARLTIRTELIGIEDAAKQFAVAAKSLVGVKVER